MIIDTFSPEELEVYKEAFKMILSRKICNITFTKKDGSARVMKCTLQSSLLPVVAPSDKPVKERKISTESMAVYDLENLAWKSFRWDSLTELEEI